MFNVSDTFAPHPSRLPDAHGDGDDGGDGDDDRKLPVELHRPQNHSVSLEKVERVEGLKKWKRCKRVKQGWELQQSHTSCRMRNMIGGTLILMRFSPYSTFLSLTSYCPIPEPAL